MISIIICSKTPSLFNEISKNIQFTIGIEHEIIMISNPNGKIGICQAYNEGAMKANYEYLVFCHEDILFHTKNWGEVLIRYLENDDISLVGILGNTVKTKIPSGVYSNVKSTNRINQLQRLKDLTTVHYLTNPLNDIISEVKILDGMFLATKKKKLAKKLF